MVYFSKKQVTQNLPSNIVKSDSNNNFSGTNTFTGSVVVPTPTNANQAANKSYVDNAVSGCAKLGAANTFTQQNTFNLRINSNKGFETTNANADILKMELQGEKTANVVFKQTQTGYLNYCNMKFAFTQNDSTYTNLLTFTFRPNNNEGVFLSTSLNCFDFGNKEIKSVVTPTTNTSVANKQYVDNRVKLIEKSGFSFTRQVINNAAGNQVIKYYGGMNYTTIGITNTSQILSCYLKTIPSQGQHLVVTFFGEYNTDNLLVEIYQYGSNTDITTQLNSAVFRIGYINS